jgi:hypothetical protein
MIENFNAIIRDFKEEQKILADKTQKRESELQSELHRERSMRIKNAIRLRQAEDRVAQLEGEKYGIEPPTRETSIPTKREREE